MDINKELSYLRDAIKSHKLMESWRDGLFIKTEEEAEQRAEGKAAEAEAAFLRMIQSPKNDGSESYREWAIKQALGLKQNKHKVHSNVGKKRKRY